MYRRCLFFVLACLALGSCQRSTFTSLSDDALHQKANELAHKYIITDGHIDFPELLTEHKIWPKTDSLHTAVFTQKGEFDYARCKAGGLSAPFMSIFVSASYQKTGSAKEYADTLIDMVNDIIDRYPSMYAHGGSPEEVEANFKQGKVSLPMGMENGAPIGSDLKNVAYFFKRGIRYITLTHGKDNLICDSSYDTTGTWKGLSAFGREVVKEMNRVGIMIDVSHISDNTFYQVMELSTKPCVATHSSCRAYTPGFERNMSDDMIKLLAKKGGVIQINFSMLFLDGELRKAINSRPEKIDSLLKAHKVKAEDAEGKKLIEAFNQQFPEPTATVEKVADHIDHVVKIAGIDHVGLGSDFDGVGDTLPEGIKDVSQYPNLIYVLLKRGYSEKDIAKICSGNVFRVWRENLG